MYPRCVIEDEGTQVWELVLRWCEEIASETSDDEILDGSRVEAECSKGAW